MRISARNQLPGTVVSIEKGAVNGVVKIEVAPGVIITSSITNAAIEELELTEGKQAVAVVKASSVMVGLQD
ncbi:molybdenum-pterin-binding protein [Actinomyces oris]|uniref:Molybdopterin-binding protein n=1 Tax=Actinomyces oris TaxID=544580 RepID=A0AAE4G1H8_9ACTO|nr:molybdopterin-binding protein [Actinomyces oris]AMD99930.1 molybdenum-pterin-binding protein [Actinomyces oris]MDT0248066.1 molybdopterin-binding protein [Actinomyces oris]